jgi:hypothetical protein
MKEKTRTKEAETNDKPKNVFASHRYCGYSPEQ